MANNCEIAMRVVGNKKSILKLLEEIPFYTDKMMESCGAWNNDASESKATFYGDCAWSIASSMLDGSNEKFNLLDRTRDLGLKLEAYSREPGIGFEEHYRIDRGEMLVSETVDYAEYDMTEYNSREDAEKSLGFPVSEREWEMYRNDWLPYGGFGDWSFTI